jgi:hypothetical protein
LRAADRDDEHVCFARDRAEVRVREWQTVTVAFAVQQKQRRGLPTMSLRPTTTAGRLPARRRTLEQSHDPDRRRPDVVGWPSTS